MTWPPADGNWEGGYTDEHGRRWLHIPNQGWTLTGPPPYLTTVRRRWLWARWWA